jgi:hypothetical protein
MFIAFSARIFLSSDHVRAMKQGLATEFSAKDKGRMKLNEVNTENNELIQRNN